MKKILLIISFCLCSLISFAQDDIEVSAPGVVSVGENFSVSFEVKGKVKDFTWSPGNNFELIWGPAESTSRSISIINGNMSSSTTHTYRYVLVAKKVGKFPLPIATAKVDSQIKKSADFTIEVIKSSGNSSRANASASAYSDDDDDDEQQQMSNQPTSEGKIFMRMLVDKKNVVVGQKINASLKLYTDANITGFEGASFPSFTGFWSQDVTSGNNVSFSKEKFNNRIYEVATIKNYVLIPQQSGKLVIDPAQLICLVSVMDRQARNMSALDMFFNSSSYTTVRRKILSPKVEIEVHALPQPAPASFSGAVGNFTVSSHLSSTNLKMNEASSLIVTVSGSGNLALMEAPKLQFPKDFELYDVKSNDNFDKQSFNGSKSFEYPFIPRAYGKFHIDPVSFSYYDVNQKKYITLHTQGFDVDVAKSTEVSGAGQLSRMASRTDVENLSQDIRYINLDNPFAESSGFLITKAIFYVIFIVLFVLAILSFFLIYRMNKLRADVIGSKFRTASKMARKRLKKAFALLNQGDYALFYAELHSSLLNFISDKFNLRVEDLTKENIDRHLEEMHLSEELRERFINLLSACEEARYAPDRGQSAMDIDYNEALDIISQIDNTMNSGRRGISTLVILALILLPSMASLSLNAKPVDMPAVSQNLSTQSKDSLWQKGLKAYQNASWQDAINAWEILAQRYPDAAGIFYNLGDAYYQQNHYGKAILNWERALKLNPSYKDARYNLNFLQNRITDKIDPVPEFFLRAFYQKLSYICSSNTWAIVSLFCFALFLITVLFFIFSRRRGYKMSSFYLGLVLLILIVASLNFSYSQYVKVNKNDYAIITSAVVSVKSSPSNDLSSKNLFLLHEGTKVKVLDRLGNWYKVLLADGRQGWLESSNNDLEEI